eukprot:8411580-Pyramimonas_sp.AAC.1
MPDPSERTDSPWTTSIKSHHSVMLSSPYCRYTIKSNHTTLICSPLLIVVVPSNQITPLSRHQS